MAFHNSPRKKMLSVNRLLIMFFPKESILINHLIPKGLWNILWLTFVFFPNDVFWTVNFFRQLSSVVDLKVYLNIWWLLKMLLFSFFKVLSLHLMWWLLISCFHFLVWGIPVHPPHPLEVTIIKLSVLISLFPGRDLFFDVLFARTSWFLKRVLLRI